MPTSRVSRRGILLEIYFISEDLFTLASYYQAELREKDFLPDGWELLPDDELDPPVLLQGGDDTHGNGNCCFYKICNSVMNNTRSNNLTGTQKEYLSRLYEAYGENEFGVEDMTRIIETGKSSARFHLHNFAERGILSLHKYAGKVKYVFAVTAEDHPECFIQKHGPMKASDAEKNKSEAAMRIAETTGLSAIA